MPLVLVDEHIYGIQRLIDFGFTLKYIQNDRPLFEQVKGCDALIVRTVNKINRTTFPYFPAELKFIGTATAGTDHLELAHINDNGVNLAHAPGSNAQAVAEYVITAMLYAFDFDINRLQKRRVGIIGHGQTGGRVSTLLDVLGIGWKAYDPPKSIVCNKIDYVPFEEVLDCDILTLHVPLTFEGEYVTREMINRHTIAHKSFDLVINAARGGVTNENDLLWGLETGIIKHIITDVWMNEPTINQPLLKASLLGTPHIAGYSIEGKKEATRMVCQQLLDTFQINERFTIYDVHETETLFTLEASQRFGNLLLHKHPMFELSKQLKMHPNHFSMLRNTHPLRDEYKRWNLTNLFDADKTLAKCLGCTISDV